MADDVQNPYQFLSVTVSRADAEAGMYGVLSGGEAGLIACWPMREGRGDQLADQSDAANHGRIVGARWTAARMPRGRP